MYSDPSLDFSIGIIVQGIGLCVLADAIKLAGPVVGVLQGVVLVVAIGLVVLTQGGSS